MTKRTKLLSLVVAAALCLVAGFAMMFSSTAKAEVTVPDAPTAGETRLDLDWSATGQPLAFAQDSGTETDWFVYDFYIPAGVTNSAETVNTVVTTAYQYNGANLSDAENTTVAATINVATLFDNEGGVPKRVRVAFDLVNGKVYTSDGAAEFVEAATYTNWAYVSSAASKYTYLHLGTPSAKQLLDVKVYTEDGAFTGWRTGNPGNTNNDSWFATKNDVPAIPVTAVKPTVEEVSYMYNGKFDLRNENPTTSDWIIFEYTIEAGATYSNAQNGVFTCLSNNGHTEGEDTTSTTDRSSRLHAFADAIPPQSIGNNCFAAAEESNVKVAVNTATGMFAYCVNGTWTSYSGIYAASGIDGEDRYFCFKTHGATASGVIKNVVCYDANGVDLGITTTMSEYKEITIEIGTPGVVESWQRWNISYTTKDDQGEACDYTFALAAGTTIQVNGEDFELVSGISCAYQGLLLVPAAAFGYEKVNDVPGMHVVLPAEATGLTNDIEFYINGLANGSLTAPQVGTFANEEGALGAQGGANQMRWIGDMNFVNDENEDVAGFFLGNVLAKKGGTEDTVLKFAHAGGATQLFYLESNHTEVAWTMNDWYLLEAGTMLGKDVILSEDYIIAISGTTFKWFPADKVMNITYEGADAGSNPTTFSYGDTTALAAPADIAGKETLGWYCGDKKVESLADVANTAVSGDFTLTARYSDKVVFDGVLAMGGQVGALNRFIINADNFIVSAADGSQTFNITENIGTINVLKNGTDAATLSFVFSGGYHIVQNLAQFGLEEGASIEEIPFQWFLIEEGTIFGGYVIGEDTVVRVNGASLIFLPADHEFTITYEGADAGSNPTSFAFSDDEITLADPAPVAGKVFAGWYVDGVKVEVINPAEYSANVTLTAKFVTEVTLKDYVEIGAQTNFDRYLVDAEEIVFFDGTNDIPATFDLGTIAALDMEGNPINIVFVKAADANGTYQLIQSTVFGQDVIADVARAAYLIEAGTVIGDYILAEDVVLIVDGANGAALMPVDYEFAISYENVREATNGNATSYAIDDTIELANLEKAGMTFLGWYDGETQVTEIAFPAFYGDVTLTAKWAQADFIKMNGEIMPSGMLVVNFYAVVENLENVSITYNGQPGMPGVLDANKSDALGLPVYKFSAMVIAWEIDADTTAVILSGADEVASFTGAPVDYLETFLDSQDAELKALVASFIAYAADMDAQMNGSTEIDVPQAATLATIPEVGYGELGMKDDANKFDAPAVVGANPVLVFNTDKTGELIVKINGEEFDTITVAEGKIAINIGELTAANVIGAKLTVEVYQGTTKLGNTAVINVAAVMGDLYEEAPATVNMVARILALYNALAAYIAD